MTTPVKPLDPAAASPRTFITQLIAGVLAANLFVATLIGLSIHQSYRQQQERAEITTQNLAKVLESEVAGILKNDDMALLSVLDEHQRQRAAGTIDKKALNAHIERVCSRLPEIDALRVTDAQGLLVFGSGVNAATKTSLADRPHFIRLRNDAKAGLVISQPQVSRVNQKWVIVLARRIDQPDGTFGGMVFAAISLEHLSRTFSALNVGPRGIVTLRDNEMGIVIRHPEPSGVGSVVGQRTAPAPLRKMALAGQKAGTYTALSTVDGTERTFSYRRVENHPLLIIVGLATDDYLAEWQSQTAKLAGMIALFILITFVAAWMIYRSWKQRMNSIEALAHQEIKFRTMADYTYDWEYWQGTDQGILYMTPSCERVTGYSSAEFVADSGLLQRVVHPDDRYVMNQHMQEIAHKEGAMTDFRIVRRDGEIRWIAHHCHAIHDEGGKPMGRRVSNRDITERKCAENALQESETRLHELFENMGNGVAVYQPSADGADFIITAMNRAAERIENRQCDDLIGKNVKDVFPGIVEMGLLDVFRRVWQSGKAEPFPVSLYHDGRISGWRENYVYKLPSGEIVAIYNDITERKKAEMQLRELNETLEQRVDKAVHKSMEHERLLIQQSRLAAMGEMIGNIAHQWRQPLNALALMQANVRDDFEYGELNQESMDKFVADGQKIIQKMSSTIDDFRDFFKPQKEKKTFLAHQIVSHTLEIVNASFKNHSIVITVKEDSDIPVTGYPNELSQVLLNVLNNARDALLDRKVANGKIDIAIGQDEGMAWIVVRDNAGGIPPETLPKIFDPYFTTREKGTGIGLYMSRMIMEHMNGSIEAHNVEGGAEFRLAMPISSR